MKDKWKFEGVTFSQLAATHQDGFKTAFQDV
jgi:hypothetical protein